MSLKDLMASSSTCNLRKPLKNSLALMIDLVPDVFKVPILNYIVKYRNLESMIVRIVTLENGVGGKRYRVPFRKYKNGAAATIPRCGLPSGSFWRRLADELLREHDCAR